MKTVLLFIFLVTGLTFGQFRDELNKPIDLKAGITNNSPSSLFLDFINPQNFSMNHSFSLSYSAFSGGGMALGMYTNSLKYKFNDQLNIEADVSILNSPYNSFGKEFTDQINGVYLSRLEMNYKPSDNFKVVLQYSQMPMSYYSPYYGSSRYYNPFFYGRDLEKD
jgi:hypothetical protein